MRCCHVSRFHIFNSIALYYCYVYVFFCLCCSSWYENEANNFIGKNDNKKISPLLKIFYILFPFHLQDSLLLFFDTIWHQWYLSISIQKKISFLFILFIDLYQEKYFNTDHVKAWRENGDKYSGSGNFLFALKSIAECSSNNRETWDDFQKKSGYDLDKAHTKTQETIFIFWFERNWNFLISGS